MKPAALGAALGVLVVALVAAGGVYTIHEVNSAPACPSIQQEGTGHVPSVVGQPLLEALSTLGAAGYGATVDRFPDPPLNGVDSLSSYTVSKAEPEAGAFAPRGIAVALTVGLSQGQQRVAGPHRPARVPDLVGVAYPDLSARADGLVVRVASVDPLKEAASTCGARAFAVDEQAPAAGTPVTGDGIVKVALSSDGPPR